MFVDISLTTGGPESRPVGQPGRVPQIHGEERVQQPEGVGGTRPALPMLLSS